MDANKPRNRLSRRAALRVGLAAIAAASPLRHAALAQQTQPVQKVDKAEAKYEDRPHGQQRCAICLNFRPPNRCEFVAGDIKPTGWCQYFAARENAH